MGSIVGPAPVPWNAYIVPKPNLGGPVPPRTDPAIDDELTRLGEPFGGCDHLWWVKRPIRGA